MISETNIVRIENLVAGYNGKPILNGFNLHLLKGEICCVIGEEGAGKSTLLKAITNQLISKGKISYNGTDLNKVPTAKMNDHDIDFIAQGGNILNGFTVEEHICLSLSKRSTIERSIAWKELESIFPKIILLKKQVAGTLSGGERMILSICCVMATDSNFLILDEPTSGLAPENCEVIGDFLKRMKDERGKTILLMEHNYDFAFKFADSIVIIKEGKSGTKFQPIDFRQPDFTYNKLYSNIII